MVDEASQLPIQHPEDHERAIATLGLLRDGLLSLVSLVALVVLGAMDRVIFLEVVSSNHEIGW